MVAAILNLSNNRLRWLLLISKQNVSHLQLTRLFAGPEVVDRKGGAYLDPISWPSFSKPFCVDVFRTNFTEQKVRILE
jgi:hypothetical protein